MSELMVKHMYVVKIHWLEHDAEYKSVLACNSFQAKNKVIEGSGKGMYDAEKSIAIVTKYNVAVQRSLEQEASK